MRADMWIEAIGFKATDVLLALKPVRRLSALAELENKSSKRPRFRV